MGNDKLIMKQPSAWHRDMYREAAPVGNGIIGALVYGGICLDRIAVNHCRLWEKGKPQELPDVHETLQDTRRHIDAGDYWGGNWCSANALKEKGYAPRLGNPVPVCDLYLSMRERKLFRHYRRIVHMDRAEAEVTWQEEDAFFSRRLFVSRREDMLFYEVRIEGRPQTMVLGAERHETYEDDTKKKWENTSFLSFAEGNCFGFEAQHEDHTWYGVLGEIRTDGQVESGAGTIRVVGATRLTLAVRPVIGQTERLVGRLGERLPETMFDYEARLREHTVLHEELYRRMELSLQPERQEADGQDCGPANETLLAQAYEDTAPLELLERQWKLGRYLMICGTREGGLPFSLYGLWHGRYKMPWPHNMANENVQMIYWHTLTGNLTDMMKPLIHYYTERMPRFRECAKKLFGLPGIYMPAGTTPEHCLPTQIVPVILNWIGCAGWISQHFYRYYLYTQDDKLLREEILPFMLEAAEFYENYIVRGEDGLIRIYPSVSPENTPENLIPQEQPDMAHPCPSVENATMDIAIMKELFTNLLTLSGQTGLCGEKRELWRDILAHLPAYETTPDGDMREWQKEGLEQRYNHRHLSHIYPLFPGTEAVRGRDDESLVQAFENAVDKRELGAQTGWSLAHMACIYARLQRPEKALECLDILDKSCLLPNLFTLHNDWRDMGLTLGRGSAAPIQLDAAMGIVQAVQEMLLFADTSCMKLLPALPERFASGRVSGMRFPAGTLSLEWNRTKESFSAAVHAEWAVQMELILPAFAGECFCKKEGADTEKRSMAGREQLVLSAGETLLIWNGEENNGD